MRMPHAIEAPFRPYERLHLQSDWIRLTKRLHAGNLPRLFNPYQSH